MVFYDGDIRYEYNPTDPPPKPRPQKKYDSSLVKKCSKCGYHLPLMFFNKDKTKKDGYQSKCRDCSNKTSSAYTKANRAKLTEYMRKRRAEGKDK